MGSRLAMTTWDNQNNVYLPVTGGLPYFDQRKNKYYNISYWSEWTAQYNLLEEKIKNLFITARIHCNTLDDDVKRN